MGGGADRETRCLVVDDDHSMRLLTQVSLADQGGEVLIAATPEEAAALLRDEGPFAMVIADRKLVNASGVDTLRLAAELQAPEPVLVLLTAHVDDRVRHEAEEVGALAVDKLELQQLATRWGELVHGEPPGAQ